MGDTTSGTAHRMANVKYQPMSQPKSKRMPKTPERHLRGSDAMRRTVDVRKANRKKNKTAKFSRRRNRG